MKKAIQLIRNFLSYVSPVIIVFAIIIGLLYYSYSKLANFLKGIWNSSDKKNEILTANKYEGLIWFIVVILIILVIIGIIIWVVKGSKKTRVKNNSRSTNSNSSSTSNNSVSKFVEFLLWFIGISILIVVALYFIGECIYCIKVTETIHPVTFGQETEFRTRNCRDNHITFVIKDNQEITYRLPAHDGYPSQKYTKQGMNPPVSDKDNVGTPYKSVSGVIKVSNNQNNTIYVKMIEFSQTNFEKYFFLYY